MPILSLFNHISYFLFIFSIHFNFRDYYFLIFIILIRSMGRIRTKLNILYPTYCFKNKYILFRVLTKVFSNSSTRLCLAHFFKICILILLFYKKFNYFNSTSFKIRKGSLSLMVSTSNRRNQMTSNLHFIYNSKGSSNNVNLLFNKKLY